MNKKLAERIEDLEKAVEAIGAWIGEQRRREAQATADAQRDPVISKVDESGERWIGTREDFVKEWKTLTYNHEPTAPFFEQFSLGGLMLHKAADVGKFIVLVSSGWYDPRVLDDIEIKDHRYRLQESDYMPQSDYPHRYLLYKVY